MNVLDLIINDKDIIKHLYNQEEYDRIKKNSIYLTSGGHGKIFTPHDKKDRLIKTQKLYVSKPTHNSDLYIKPSKDCCYIKESFLLECIIMENLSKFTVLIPKLYKIILGKEKGEMYSLMIMEKQDGTSYLQYYRSVSKERLYRSWYHFIEDMKLLFEQFNFLHGDLISENMLVDFDRIKLIDFGLSIVRLRNILFLRHHVIPRILKLNVGLDIQKMASIDICKLLYREEKTFDPKIQQLFETCQGVNGKRSLKNKFFPNPVYIHSEKLTFDLILKDLEKKLKN